MEQKKQRVREIASIIGFVAIIVVICSVLGEMLTPITYATYFNHDMELIEESGTEVDLVLIGPSRTYLSFVPSVIEEANGYSCVVNAGSSAQHLSGTYYQLKELLENNKVKQVGIDVNYRSLIDEPIRASQLIVLDRLKGNVKRDFIRDCFSGEDFLWTNNLYRYRNDIFSMIENYREIKRLKGRNYVPEMVGKEYYADTGFSYGCYAWETGTIPIRTYAIWEEKLLRNENKEYLDRCITLCEEYGIEPFLYTGITSMMRMYYSEGVQEMINFYIEYAAEKGFVYHNYNLLKDREIIYPDEMMLDFTHLNGEGAMIFSKTFAEILEKDLQGIDTSDYFYSSVDEMKKDVKRVVAVGATVALDKEAKLVTAKDIISLQNDDIIPEYQLLISLDDTNYEPLTEWCTETELQAAVPKESGFKIMLRARTGIEGDAEAYQVWSY